MTNTPRGDGPDPTQPMGPDYPGYVDPAYAGQSPYGPTYQAPQGPDPTQQLPPYSPYGHDPYGYTPQGTMIPTLFDVPRYAKLGDGEARWMLETQLVRDRNRIADALVDCRRLIEGTLRELS